MFNQGQIQQLAQLIFNSGISIKNQDEVPEYLWMLLEDIAGCEHLTDSEFENVKFKVQLALKGLTS